MWVVCKKRKISEAPIHKRKRVDNVLCEYNNNIKRQKLLIQFHILKRKSDSYLEKSKHKKQKVETRLQKHSCLIHEESYICDIYECSCVHVKDIQHPEHMPYIV